ncbi:hypothetical protein [Saliphagus sp. LR7]|uniref:DUF7344 domain-containing protein n=1 Tax=Saliphagus sp. LR7 TaxID=2282654 RepID=UPI000DF78382|nr:hypothetical protein [Saliphagus sp. LR7]
MTVSSDDGGTVDLDAQRADGLSVPPALFDTLSAPARRHAMAALSKTPGPIGVSDLTGRVADRLERETGHRALEIEVRHVHLPALSDAGLVEWHQAEDVVDSTARGASLVAPDGQ